jgi:hypothetical protein
MATPAADDEGFGAHLVACLEPILGPHTSRHAIKLAATQLDLMPEALRWQHAGAVAQTLAPLLRTLIGRASADAVRAKILEREAGEAT